MGFDIFPKNVIKGETEDGKSFIAKEYDFDTYSNLQMLNLIYVLVVGSLFCSIAAPLILLFILFNFTGKFNLMYLAIPILGGYFIYDCANGWIMSLLLNFFIDEKGLLVLVGINITCLIIIGILTVFGSVIVSIINVIAADKATRYLFFFILVGVLAYFTYSSLSKDLNVEWLGLTKIHRELGHIK
jgi:hypothetical protein